MRHRCLASFIVFILFFTIYGFISFGVLRSVTTAKFLNSALASSNFYNNLQELANSLADSSGEQNFQGQIFIKLFGQLIEPADLRAQVEKNSTVFIEYLRNENSSLGVSFDLRNLKNAVKIKSGIVLPPIVAEEVKTLPICEANQQPSQEINCIPADKSQVDFTNQLMENYNPDDLLKMLPDQFVLSDYIKDPAETFHGPRLFYTIIKIGFYVDLILSFIFIFFLILLGKSNPASIFRWAGAALMIPGAVSLLEVFLSKPLANIATQQIYAGMKHESIKFASPLIDAISANSLQIALIYSGAVFFLGLILIIISYIVPHDIVPHKDSPAAIPPPAQPTPGTGGLTEAK